jgi:hypothetical protein
MENRERPPSMQETSMVDPWEMMTKIRECPPSMQEMLMASLLGGDDGDPGAPTINTKNVDSEPPGPCVCVGGGVRSPSRIRKVCCKHAWV